MSLVQTKDFEEIVADVLAKFSAKHDIRQGSTLYNLTAAIAQEISLAYFTLDEWTNTQFLDTAYGDALTRLALQFGVKRHLASSAIREAFFIEPVQVGMRFSVVDSDLNFVVSADNGEGMYHLRAETPGIESNTVQGELLNIDFMDTFSGAVLGRVVISGEEIETDDELRERAIARVSAAVLNGNGVQYELWAQDFEGVGTVKVDPLWNGENTVKVSITDAIGDEASNELVDSFQAYLDPEPKGHGLGVAPIGAYVTVAKIAAIRVNISADITLAEGYEVNIVKEAVRNEMTNYFRNEALKEEEVKNYKVITLIDRVLGVDRVSNVMINGATSSLTIDNGVPPVLNEVTLNVLG